MKRLYLLTYNLIQCLGWASMWIQFVPHVSGQLVSDQKAILDLYNQVSPLLQVFQTIALLEVLHGCLGLVKTSPLMTFFQNFNRIFITWIIFYGFEAPKQSLSCILTLFAWINIEVFRYPFYVLSLLKLDAKWVSYLRYTLFVPLYPMGLIGETWSVANSLNEVERVSMWLFYFFILMLVLYPFIFLRLYKYMFKQRSKFMTGLKEPKLKE